MLDQTIRHSIFLQRYAAAEFRKIKPVLSRLARKLKRELRDNKAALLPSEQARLEVLLRDIEATIREQTRQVNERIGAIVRPLAENEVNFYQEALSQQVTIPIATLPANIPQIIASNASMSLVSGDVVEYVTINSALNTFAGAVSRDVRRAVLEDGILLGKTPKQITDDVFKLVNTRTQQQADAIVRTIANAVSTEAISQVAENNAGLLDGYRWLSVLDGRTTPVCRARDGQVYPIGSPVSPPAHYRCRSVLIMMVKKEYRVPGYERTRSSADGYKSESFTYQSWLREQDVEVQKEILGEARYKLFSKGGLALDKFVDERGVEYTLDQLRQSNALAFKKAGL